ncbi:hypothetical protein CO666_05790 [Rhizobium chutanense]|uniref:Uncharacterized protein n=1 Tax=Rhizobium chutanense TaxID=2035448 RepID=A0A2A6JGS5_9HYPH|nr:hypothetical protein [Rhizobium chutanense]PDT05139.1 hypothetical protein CO666_05790 [Rhizobium chutanense]
MKIPRELRGMVAERRLESTGGRFLNGESADAICHEVIGLTDDRATVWLYSVPYNDRNWKAANAVAEMLRGMEYRVDISSSRPLK